MKGALLISLALILRVITYAQIDTMKVIQTAWELNFTGEFKSENLTSVPDGNFMKFTKADVIVKIPGSDAPVKCKWKYNAGFIPMCLSILVRFTARFN